jgi:uncharacterized protein (UPF0305 family)
MTRYSDAYVDRSDRLASPSENEQKVVNTIFVIVLTFIRGFIYHPGGGFVGAVFPGGFCTFWHPEYAGQVRFETLIE